MIAAGFQHRLEGQGFGAIGKLEVLPTLRASACRCFWGNPTCAERGVGLGGNVKSAKVSGNSFRHRHLQALWEPFERMRLSECGEYSLPPCCLLPGHPKAPLRRAGSGKAVSRPLAGESHSLHFHISLRRTSLGVLAPWL